MKQRPLSMLTQSKHDPDFSPKGAEAAKRFEGFLKHVVQAINI